MTRPSAPRRSKPDKPAYIMAASSETVTYGQLEARSQPGRASVSPARSCRRATHIALFMDNSARYYRGSLGRPALGPALHLHLLPSAGRRRGRVHRQGQRGQSFAIVTSAGVAAEGAEAGPLIPGVALFHGRRRPASRIHPASRRSAWGCRKRRSPTRPPAAPCSIPPAPHWPAQGRQAGGRPCQWPDRRAQWPDDDGHGALWLDSGQHLSLAGAALSRRSARLVHGGSRAGRYGDRDGAFRRRGGAGLDRDLWRHHRPVGADSFRPYAEVAGGHPRHSYDHLLVSRACFTPPRRARHRSSRP